MDARELKRSLRDLGWSQTLLAERVKMHPNSISKMVKRDEVSGAVEAYIRQSLELRKLAGVGK